MEKFGLAMPPTKYHQISRVLHVPSLETTQADALVDVTICCALPLREEHRLQST
jgi:hypothetical protein